MKNYYADGYYAFPLNTSTHDRMLAYWDEAFSFEELKKVQAICESLQTRRAGVSGGAQGTELDSIRDCTVGWIEPVGESLWIYDRLSYVMRDLNKEVFGFDLQGFYDGLQYTVYDATDGNQEFYTWHVDCFGKRDEPCRKLSLVLQLSDPFDYEGGELQLHGNVRTSIPKSLGKITVFPSYTLHRVTPVTSGIRRTLVAWAVGPEYR